ncbi:MAG: DUF4287 domain-containing protein [Actinomycetota bacterium]
MTERKTFKRRVRERMSKTGETYTTARKQVTDKRDRNEAARSRLAADDDRVSDETIEEKTGKTWDAWFSILDSWGARDSKHPEIARFLNTEHEVPGWWSQTITVAYERSRGMRLKYQQSDGFSITATKTIAVPIRVLFEAFVDDGVRGTWLRDGKMSLRTSRRDRSARFDWNDGATRVIVDFNDKGPSKSTVALAHERLPDADEAETAKTLWRERLARLKSILES